jgi:hypothetical protein
MILEKNHQTNSDNGKYCKFSQDYTFVEYVWLTNLIFKFEKGSSWRQA